MFVCFSFTVNGQEKDSIDWSTHDFNREHTDIGAVIGLHQFNNTFFELGISTSKSRQGCAFGSYFNGMSLSAEYDPFKNIGGVGFTRWTSLMSILVIGINVNSYTDFDNYNVGIKPSIGFGSALSFTYGYNFQIVNNGVDHINRHCFSLRYHLTIKELR